MHRTRPSRPVRRPARGLCALLLGVVLAGCLPGAGDPVPTPSAVPAVRVGTGPQAEARLLAAVVVGLLRAEGLPSELVELADASDARQALELGDVEVLPSYTGEAWLEVLERADPPSDQATSLARVAEFDARDGLVWLRPRISPTRGVTSPPADATFAFVVADDGPHGDVATLSQLATRLGQRTAPVLCVDPAFANRDDGLAVVLDAYSIAPDSVDVVAAAPDDAVRGVAAGDCDAGLTSGTDGAAWAAGQRPLVDDLGVFPAFVVAPVVDAGLLARRPAVEDALRPLTDGLTTALLGSWNARVAAGEPPAVVATDAVAVLLS